MGVRVQSEPFDISKELLTLKGTNTDIGAIVTFTGVVRGEADGIVLKSMTLEHYPGMTEAELEAVEREALERWPLKASLIVHRVGELLPGDDIVLVIAASAHRTEAFEAAAFLMDYLKVRAPFWKKEETLGGDSHWVDARECDRASLEHWKTK